MMQISHRSTWTGTSQLQREQKLQWPRVRCARIRVAQCHDAHQYKAKLLSGDEDEHAEARREGWDVSKEQARRFRRTVRCAHGLDVRASCANSAAASPQVYTFLDWKKHRSSHRYTRHFSTFIECVLLQRLPAGLLHNTALTPCTLRPAGPGSSSPCSSPYSPSWRSLHVSALLCGSSSSSMCSMHVHVAA
jgi:hypothetical protein